MLLLTLQHTEKKGTIHHHYDEIFLLLNLAYGLPRNKTIHFYSHLTAVIKSISKLDVPCCLIDE
jgi:predicted GNAT superfamily acetyltransferase